MIIKNNFNLHFKLFILFTIFLLIEGFHHYFSYKLVYLCFDNLELTMKLSSECLSKNYLFKNPTTGFEKIIWAENGIVEILQIILLLFSIIFWFFIIKKNIKILKINFLIIFMFLYFLGIIYFFLEEISYGQHFFKWISSEFFILYNDQKETNIHNISNLFNEFPRSMLTLWCSLSFIFVRFLPYFKIKDEFYSMIIYPSKKLKYISVLLIIFFIPNFVADKFGIHPGFTGHTVAINMTDIFDFLTFNFIRLSEYQELIFTYYIFNHTLFFKKYIYSKIN